MQDLGDKATLNGSTKLMKDFGCAVAVIANMLNLNLDTVNKIFVTQGRMKIER